MKIYKFIFKIIKRYGMFGEIGTKELSNMIIDYQSKILDNEEFRNKNKLILEKVDEIIKDKNKLILEQVDKILKGKEFSTLTVDELPNENPEKDLPVLELQPKQSS